MMAPHLDGTWAILYAARDGHQLDNTQNESVTIRGNVLTWKKEGKAHNLHLQFGPNHLLTGWPEHAMGASQQANPAEHAQGATTKEPAHAQARPTAPAQAPAPARDDGAQGQILPRATTLPEGVRQLPGAQLGQQPVQQLPAGQPHPLTQQAGQHNGVFIDANEYLCLAFDQAFEGEMHNQPTTSAVKPGLPNQPAAGAARPGTPAGQPANPPAANTNRVAAGTPQPATAQAPRPGETRTANYGEQHNAGNMQQRGFVLILRREGGQQNLPGQGNK
jgi:hypothetical protein